MPGLVIVLEGLIGVGKSTLGRSLEKHLSNIAWMPEPINEELLKLYISNMARYAFPFQTIVARERIQSYKEARRLASQGKTVIIDRGLPGDLAFAQMQKDKGFFTEEEFRVYLNLTSESSDVPKPDIIVYLDCTPETAWKRILARSNPAEKKGYNLQYLKDLSKAYEKSLAKSKVLRINWNKEHSIKSNLLSKEICLDFLKMCQQSQ